MIDIGIAIEITINTANIHIFIKGISLLIISDKLLLLIILLI